MANSSLFLYQDYAVDVDAMMALSPSFSSLVSSSSSVSQLPGSLSHPSGGALADAIHHSNQAANSSSDSGSSILYATDDTYEIDPDSIEYRTFVTDVNNRQDNETMFVPGDNNGKVVMYICNGAYCDAVVMSIQSLRVDGGYKGDVVVVLEETNGLNTTSNVTRASMSHQLRNQNMHQRVALYTVKELMDSLYSDLEQSQLLNHARKEELAVLQEPPPLLSCFQNYRRRAHMAYYRKLLVYHPTIALQWSHVLFMDTCMTFHLPYLDKIFELSQVQHPRTVLATLDLWRWRHGGLKQKLFSSLKNDNCQVDVSGEALLRQIVKTSSRMSSVASSKKDILTAATFYNSAFSLYDTSVVRNYRPVTGTSSSTLIEMMRLHHRLANVFQGGGQEIQSVYWMYLRHPTEFAVLPTELWSHDDRAVLTFSFEPPTATASKESSWKHDVRKYSPMPIVTAINLDRGVCAHRSVNAAYRKQINDAQKKQK
ncbi:MAG: hypothetical protein SGILL_006278 [Bacillariaceae sp.]